MEVVPIDRGGPHESQNLADVSHVLRSRPAEFGDDHVLWGRNAPWLTVETRRAASPESFLIVCVYAQVKELDGEVGGLVNERVTKRSGVRLEAGLALAEVGVRVARDARDALGIERLAHEVAGREVLREERAGARELRRVAPGEEAGDALRRERRRRIGMRVRDRLRLQRAQPRRDGPRVAGPRHVGSQAVDGDEQHVEPRALRRARGVRRFRRCGRARDGRGVGRSRVSGRSIGASVVPSAAARTGREQ